MTLPVTFNGGDGADGLFGGGGTDTFNGGAQNDNIIARDGRVERVDCGSGDDTAITDDLDVRVSCEQVEGDADGDGVRRPADCDDTRPTVRPGAVDVPDNGIDEDCSGGDSAEADRDHDGTPRPQDCNDGIAAIRPGLPELIGNDIDENCDGRSDPFPPVIGAVRTAWDAAGSRTSNVRLTLRRFAASTAIELRCTGQALPVQGRADGPSAPAGPSACTASSGTARCGPAPRSSCDSRSRGGSGACCAGRCAHRGAPRTSTSSACRPAAAPAAVDDPRFGSPKRMGRVLTFCTRPSANRPTGVVIGEIAARKRARFVRGPAPRSAPRSRCSGGRGAGVVQSRVRRRPLARRHRESVMVLESSGWFCIDMVPDAPR